MKTVRNQKTASITLLAAVLVTALSAAHVAAQTTPIRISTYTELILIGASTDMPLGGSYELANDIDASASRTANDGLGHRPIGPFTGTFNGMGYTIRGLYINRPDADNVGLFGLVGGEIRDLNVEADSVVGKNYVGVVAGSIGSGLRAGTRINTIYARGTVVGVDQVGGVVGDMRGFVGVCTFRGTVVGRNAVGGVVGSLDGYAGSGEIKNSFFDGTVTGINQVGGLVGVGGAVDRIGVEESRTVGTVSGMVEVGGLVGQIVGQLRNSSSTAAVTGDSAVGGLAGSFYWSFIADHRAATSYATGNVNGRTRVGGLMGHISDVGIDSSYAIGNVTATGAYVGGLIGYASGRTNIVRSYATGAVYSDSSFAGGLIGMMSDSATTIRQSYATGRVEAISNIGGLVGNSRGTIEDSYFVGSVFGESNIGGIVGVNRGAIVRTYSSGAVTLIDSPSNPNRFGYGGLVGINSNGTLLNSVVDTVVSVSKVIVGTAPTQNPQGTVSGSSTMPTSEMFSNTTYQQGRGWNMTDVWFTTGIHYPYLRALPTQRFVYETGDNGSIRGSVDQTVNLGAAQTVVAVADPGQIFIGWSDGVRTPERRDSDITVTEKTVRAIFGVAYTLHYASMPNGIIVGDTLQIVEAGGNGRRVTAVPDEGYDFLEWSDGVQTAARTDTEVSGDINVHPIFVDGTSVRHSHMRRGARPLVSMRAARTLVITAADNAAVDVRVVNLRGRTVARFRSVGSASYSLRSLPAGAYIVDVRRADGLRMTISAAFR